MRLPLTDRHDSKEKHMYGELYYKKREEAHVRNEERISVSYEDIMFEDFCKSKDHPYEIYDWYGNLLESNTSPDTFRNQYNNLVSYYYYTVMTTGVNL